MDKAVFDDLRVLRREYEGKSGCSEVCRDSSGQFYIRLQIRSRRCQKEYLTSKPPAPVRLDRGILEVLLPYQDGGLMGPWLAQEPSLAQRRNACLFLLAQCLDLQVAPSVTMLSARLENLRFTDQSAWLQLLPDWNDWRSDNEPGSEVAAIAALCRHILTDGYSPLQIHQFPRELQLFCARQECGGYQTWSQLQHDLAAIPDYLLPLAASYRSRLRRNVGCVKRWIKPAACIAVIILAVMALFSLWGAYQHQRSQNREPTWPGMVSVGDQQLNDR